MTDSDPVIARVLELDAEATIGPWTEEWGSQLCSIASEADGQIVLGADANRQDCTLIAEYRTLAPQLARECQRLRRLLIEAWEESARQEREVLNALWRSLVASRVIKDQSKRIAALERLAEEIRKHQDEMDSYGAASWIRCRDALRALDQLKDSGSPGPDSTSRRGEASPSQADTLETGPGDAKFLTRADLARIARQAQRVFDDGTCRAVLQELAEAAESEDE